VCIDPFNTHTHEAEKNPTPLIDVNEDAVKQDNEQSVRPEN
jgi:hypothetical protein